jgi:hypothetical protein
MCREKFSSAEIEIDRLPSNEFVGKLTEVAKIMSYAHTPHTCGVCGSTSGSEAADAKFADVYCLECKQLLCSSCRESHGNSEAAREHIVYELGDKSKSVSRLMSLIEPRCQEHKTRSFELYCFDCSSVLCRTCFDEKHSSHKCSEIEKVENEFRQLIVTYVERMDRDIDRCRQDVKKLGNIDKRLNDEIKRIENEILERAVTMTRIVDDDEGRLLQEIESSHKARTNRLDDIMDRLSRHVMLVELMKRYIEELKTKGTAVDIAREAEGLQKATDCILKADSGRQLNDAALSGIKFIAANLLTHSSRAAENVVGKVELKHTRKGEVHGFIRDLDADIRI